MPALTIELPSHAERTEFNLRRWAELLDDPELARIETDRHGHIIMSAPPAPSHGSYQSEIAFLLRQFMPEGPHPHRVPYFHGGWRQSGRRGLGLARVHEIPRQSRLLSEST